MQKGGRPSSNGVWPRGFAATPSVLQDRRPQSSRPARIKMDGGIRRTQTSSRPSGTAAVIWSRRERLEKLEREQFYSDQARVPCRRRDTRKLPVSVSSEAGGMGGPEPPQTPEDAVQNWLIYACNVSCLFRCRCLCRGSLVWSECAGRLPGKHQQS